MAREADFYTPSEAANLLGLAEFTILGLLTSGELEGRQDEQGRWWIPAAAVDEAARRGRGADTPTDPSVEETTAMTPISPPGSEDTPTKETPMSEETTEFEAGAGSTRRTPPMDND